MVFEDLRAAGEFLNAPAFQDGVGATTYQYTVVYSDGTEFVRELGSVEAVRELHAQLVALAEHVEQIVRPGSGLL